MKKASIVSRKKLTENTDPKGRAIGSKKVVTDIQGKVKIKKPSIAQTRRAAFGDLTNATEQSVENDKKETAKTLKFTTKGKTVVPPNKINEPITKKKIESRKGLHSWSNLSKSSSTCSNSSSSSSISDQVPSYQESSFPSNKQVLTSLAVGLPADTVEKDISFVVDDADTEDVTASDKSKDEAEESLLSVDQENYKDVFNVGIYAQHIFDYYKLREKMFCIPAYMGTKHCHITPFMRAILVDWMVEIQENFELFHETLYLAVKLTDMYLSRVCVEKEILQLIGAASIFIASKFDERSPPLIDDIKYICDGAFNTDQFIAMEIKILKTVNFDLGIPISYRFLRRYAKVARMSMRTLTLARYILEMSLMEYDLVLERDSLTAAAALYIAQKMTGEGTWEGDVVKSSGYTVEDITQLVVKLNTMLLANPVAQLSTIRSKYSHEVFHEVAKIVPLPTNDLL